MNSPLTLNLQQTFLWEIVSQPDVITETKAGCVTAVRCALSALQLLWITFLLEPQRGRVILCLLVTWCLLELQIHSPLNLPGGWGSDGDAALQGGKLPVWTDGRMSWNWRFRSFLNTFKSRAAKGRDSLPWKLFPLNAQTQNCTTPQPSTVFMRILLLPSFSLNSLNMQGDSQNCPETSERGKTVNFKEVCSVSQLMTSQRDKQDFVTAWQTTNPNPDPGECWEGGITHEWHCTKQRHGEIMSRIEEK